MAITYTTPEPCMVTRTMARRHQNLDKIMRKRRNDFSSDEEDYTSPPKKQHRRRIVQGRRPDPWIFRLPQEVRNTIWELCLFSPKALREGHDRVVMRRDADRALGRRDIPSVLDCLLTCRQFYEEARSMFYWMHTLCFRDTYSDMTGRMGPTLFADCGFLSAVSQSRIYAIEKLQLEIKTPSNMRVYCRALGGLPNLKSVRFILNPNPRDHERGTTGIELEDYHKLRLPQLLRKCSKLQSVHIDVHKDHLWRLTSTRNPRILWPEVVEQATELQTALRKSLEWFEEE